MREMATLVVEVAFALLFLHGLVTYLRRRDPLQRDVMFVFTAMAMVFGLEVWRRTLGPPPAWLAGVSTVLLLAQPYLTLRLTAQVRTVARPLRVAALAGLGTTILYVILSVFPIIDVPSWRMFALKISSVVIGLNLLGFVVYRLGGRRREQRGRVFGG